MESVVPLFRMEGVSKHYGGVRALDNAELTVAPGRIHAILGENGAGKSTLIKIMAGVVVPDAGRMKLEGREVSFADPGAATDAGIVCIFQELSLIPELTVADNIAISHPPTRFGLIDRSAQRRVAEEALARAGASDVHPRALVKDLPLSRRQMVEIAKALGRNPRILILDEATSALDSEIEAVIQETLYGVMEGKTVIAIAHRLSTIAHMDRIVVLDAGRIVEEGSHEALLARGGIYARLWARQSGGYIGVEPD
jgi:ribose transport system ATP-binding protein